MSINFHYFLIKTLAIEAGFGEKDSQKIASYSQFVNDYDLKAPIYISNVPNYAKHLVSFGLFYPVTTGFSSRLDITTLMLERNQRNIAVPFHFQPMKSLNKINSRLNYRVKAYKYDDKSILDELLDDEKKSYFESNNNIQLIRIGLLLHILVDSYAHQNFSGFWNWENHSKLLKVYDNINDKDITELYNPELNYKLPSIGHTNVNYALDESNISLEYVMKLNVSDNYSHSYIRNNTKEFLTCSLEILNYLRECKGLSRVDDNSFEWTKISDNIKKGLLTNLKNMDLLAVHWKRFFPNIIYKYNKDNLLRNVFTLDIQNENPMLTEQEAVSRLTNFTENITQALFSVKSDDFFRYNVFAKEIINKVNGEKINIMNEDLYDEELEMISF